MDNKKKIIAGLSGAVALAGASVLFSAPKNFVQASIFFRQASFEDKYGGTPLFWKDFHGSYLKHGSSGDFHVRISKKILDRSNEKLCIYQLDKPFKKIERKKLKVRKNAKGEDVIDWEPTADYLLRLRKSQLESVIESKKLLIVNHANLTHDFYHFHATKGYLHIFTKFPIAGRGYECEKEIVR